MLLNSFKKECYEQGPVPLYRGNRFPQKRRRPTWPLLVVIRIQGMANPQCEDGFVRIATEVWDQLCRIRIPGEVRQVVDVVIRKTWGFNKKWDWIPLSQFCQFTGISKSHIIRALRKAKQMKLVAQKGNKSGVSYCFNKNYDQWKPLPKKATLPKKETSVAKKGNEGSPKKAPSINTLSKDTSSKDITVEKDKIPYSEIISDLNEVLSANYRDKTKETRRAIDRWWKQGFRLDDFKKVHRIKADEWRGDAKMSKFLRPSTLYGPKFEDYLNQGSSRTQTLQPGDLRYVPH